MAIAVIEVAIAVIEVAIAVIEVAILENKLRFLFKVNVWTVLWDKNNGCCRKVAISEGSTS